MVLGEDRAIYIRDVEPQKRQVLSLSGQEEGNLFHALKFCEEKEIEEQVNALIDKMGDDKVYWRQSRATA